jgi:outer membrane protein assembly factor BamA
MPDHYFGVGYQNAHGTELGDTTTKYTRQWYWINPQVKFHLGEYIFLGLNLDINSTKASSVSSMMETDPYIMKYGTDNFNSGLGVLVEYDSRDRPVNAWKGLYVNLMATFYGKSLGSDNDYQIYQFDTRYYQKIKRDGKTLALQALGRFGNGNVPWGEMSQLGSPFDLRGYRWGKYRDMAMLFFLAEYRHMFWRKKTNDNSRFGFVVWAGTGSIGNDPADFKYWLPNGGVGFRFELQPRLNIRLDFGVGEQTYGFYFQFNEAY